MRKSYILPGLFFIALLFAACKKEVCIRCSPIVPDGRGDQRFCSKDKDERATFMTERIKDGFNCRED